MAIRNDINQARWGLAAGFVISLAGVGGGIYLGVLGYSIEGTILAGGTLIGLVSVFVYGTRSRRVERERKAEDNRP